MGRASAVEDAIKVSASSRAVDAPGPGPLTLGIDVGSTATKLLLLDARGQWTMASFPTDLAKTWDMVKPEIEAHAARIRAVGITGQGQSALLIDSNCQQVGPMQTWRDPLTVPPVALGDACQLHPDGGWLPRRLAQWRADNPDLDISDCKALQIKDMLNAQLTGVRASDARSLRGWLNTDGSVCANLGMGEIKPTLFPPESVIGSVTAEAAAISGLPRGTPLICGCDDLAAGVAGLGLSEGDAFNLANTSEHIGMISDCPKPGVSWVPPCGALPGLAYAATATGAGTLQQLGWTLTDAAALGERMEIEGEPRFDAAIAGRRGLSPDPTHVGGWSGPHEHLSANERGWRVLDGLCDALVPIRDALEIEGVMRMGGGLAEVGAVVESRRARWPVEVGAGQEVSVLGVARLAQPVANAGVAVIFGAGKVGRGFIAHLLARAGWRFHLVEAHAPTLARLRAAGSWSVRNLGTGQVETLCAESIVDASDENAVAAVLDEADLLFTSLGGGRLESWAKDMRQLLCERLTIGPIDLVLAENHPAPAAAVRGALLDGALNDEAAMIDDLLGIAQAQVLRSCIEPTAGMEALDVQVQDHWTLPLDGDALRCEWSIAGMEPKPQFAVELTRKLYTYNCINAVVAYLGHLRGHTWLAEAANDAVIAEVARLAGEEASAALIAEFGFDADEQAAWCARALAKYQDETIRDPIERNARDVARKVGAHERLVGPILLARKHGLPSMHIAIGLAAACRYGLEPPAEPGCEVDAAAEAALDGMLHRSMESN